MKLFFFAKGKVGGRAGIKAGGGGKGDKGKKR